MHFCNIDKKMNSKSVYYYDFWRSCDTEDWSNDAENTALITGINYILTYIHIENSYFKLESYFTILQFLLYFWSNKCSFGDLFQNLTTNFWAVVYCSCILNI